MGIVIEHTDGQGQAGMSREGRRTMEKVLERGTTTIVLLVIKLLA